MQSMIQHVTDAPEQFNQYWSAKRQTLIDNIARKEPSSDGALATKIIQWQWASGLINYPYFHQRETGRPVPADWPPLLAAIESIKFDDASALQSPQYIELVNSWLHDRGMRRIKEEREFSQGDNRWLRVSLSLVEKSISDVEIKRFFISKLLSEHIDENGAKNCGPLIAMAERYGVEKSQLDAFRSALKLEETPPDDHIAITYQTIDTVDMQLHVFSAKDTTALSPAFIWFHGGSWSTGHWSYCPVLCRALQKMGFVVIQVEYRTSQRFDGTPLDALADARRAVDFTIEHAAEFHIDRKKIMTGGFSSGGALASQMAILHDKKVSAGAYISAAIDPSKDSWYTSVVANKRDPKQLSPLLMASASSPPQIFFHAKDDEMCDYQDLVNMSTKLSKLSVQNRLVTFDQGGHFFVFKSPEDRQRIVSELTSFIKQIGW